MTLAIIIYVLIGFGAAVRRDDETESFLERILTFVVIWVVWPTVIGAIITDNLWGVK